MRRHTWDFQFDQLALQLAVNLLNRVFETRLALGDEIQVFFHVAGKVQVHELELAHERIHYQLA